MQSLLLNTDLKMRQEWTILLFNFSKVEIIQSLVANLHWGTKFCQSKLFLLPFTSYSPLKEQRLKCQLKCRVELIVHMINLKL